MQFDFKYMKKAAGLAAHLWFMGAYLFGLTFICIQYTSFPIGLLAYLAGLSAYFVFAMPMFDALLKTFGIDAD